MTGQLPAFDELLRLAQEDPEKLEQLRQEACEALIESAPEECQRKLRGLQFKIDMERRRAKSPMAACIKISSMMQESFSELRNALNEVQTIKAPSVKGLINRAASTQKAVVPQEEIAESAGASIVQFPPVTT